MARYRLIYTETSFSRILGYFPLLGLSFDDAINSPGSMAITIPLDNRRAIDAPVERDATNTVRINAPLIDIEDFEPAETTAFIERNGGIIAGGPIWTARLSVDNDTITLGAEGWLSYLRRIHIDQDLDFVDVDQGLIAQQLVDLALAKLNTPVKLNSGSTPRVSQNVTQSYAAAERKNVGGAIEQLANVFDGFSFRFSHRVLLPNSPAFGIQSTFEVEPDPRGRLTRHVFDIGRASRVELSLDGKMVTTFAEAWGTGQADGGIFVDRDNFEVGGPPRLETIETFNDISNFFTLFDKANFIVARGAKSLRRLQMRIKPSDVSPVGSYHAGDRVTLKGSNGRVTAEGAWRIVELGVQVDRTGTEEVALSLVPEEFFSSSGALLNPPEPPASPQFQVVDSDELAFNSETTFTVPATIEDDDILLVWVSAAGSGDPGAATASIPAGSLTQIYSHKPQAGNFQPRQTKLGRVLVAATDANDTCTVSPGSLSESIGWAVVRGLSALPGSEQHLNGGSPDGIQFPDISASTDDIVFLHGSAQSASHAEGDASTLDITVTEILTQLTNNRGQWVAYYQVPTGGTIAPGTLDQTGGGSYDNWVGTDTVAATA